jgi:hypothetical protein
MGGVVCLSELAREEDAVRLEGAGGAGGTLLLLLGKGDHSNENNKAGEGYRGTKVLS